MSAARAWLPLSLVLLVLALIAIPGGSATRSGSPFYVVPAVTKECDNVPDCSAVTGPWVVVPAGDEATYLLKCPAPQGFLVGGSDARASSPEVRVWFDGQLGAPIGSPSAQDTSGAYLLFHAVTDNAKPGAFQPIVGCISLYQLNPRLPVGVVLPGTTPGSPAVLVARRISLLPGKAYGLSTVGTSVRCPRGHRTLVGEWDALTFTSPGPPDVTGLNPARMIRTVTSGDSVQALVQTTNRALFDQGVFPYVQVGAMCEQ